MDGIDVLIILARVVGAFLLWLLGTALLIWGERRLVARMQSRVGPNRLGPFGLLQVIADGAKMFFKEDITPGNVDKVVYGLAPMVSTVVALLTFAVIPYGGTFEVGGREVTLQVWDPEIGLLWVLAMSSLGVYGIALGGWASGSKYPLLGGVRSSAQMISYELGMGLAMAAVFVYNGTLRASEIVAAQSGTLWGFLPAWNLIPMAPAFLIFFLSAVAEAQRPPFDLAEAEGELVGGFHTEYSGAKFAMFMLGEFMAVITMSAVTVTLFLGGPSGPLPAADAGGLVAVVRAVLPTIYFIAKVLIFVFVFIWLRATLPRLRYDRLMALGWRVLLPLGLLWVMASAFAVVVRQQAQGLGDLRFAAVVIVVTAAILYLVAPLFSRRTPVEDAGGGSTGRGGGAGGRGPAGAGPSGGRPLTRDPGETSRATVAAGAPAAAQGRPGGAGATDGDETGSR